VAARTVSGLVQDAAMHAMLVPLIVDEPFGENQLAPPLVLLKTLLPPA
jgi:hypothetical protein